MEIEKTDKKIRVIHFCNQLGVGGTERTMELFCTYLDRSRFEIFVVSVFRRPKFLDKLRLSTASALGHSKSKAKLNLWASFNARIPNFKKIIPSKNLFLIDQSKNLDEAIAQTIKNIKPDVLHVHYSGTAEPPTNNFELLSSIPVTLTTNQFEIQNTSKAHSLVKKMFFVSKWMLENKATWAKNDPRAEVFYNLIEKPLTKETLRSNLGIPKDAFVVGRIGRADSGIHDPISLKAYREVTLKSQSKTPMYFLALSAPENMLRDAKEMGIKNFISLPANTDPVYVSRFFNSIDVLAHARRDGETFGCNIAEAMMHRKPVISHLTPYMNAQKEIIGNGGFVVEEDEWQDYAEHLRQLYENPGLREEIAQKALSRALSEFEAERLTKRLEQSYLELLSQKARRTYEQTNQVNANYQPY
ncbi:MAG: glycosyltransferase family 4 protein [Bacteriovoracia bacterium]